MTGVILLQTCSGAGKEAMGAGSLPLPICIPETIFAPAVILLQYLRGNKSYAQTLSQIRPHMAVGTERAPWGPVPRWG